jgi:hypothetical protein
MLQRGAQERPLQLPAAAFGHISTQSAPPHAQHVSCAQRVAACLLSLSDAGNLSFYDLSLDGSAPTLRFRIAAPAVGRTVWALSADAQRIAVADVGAQIRVFDRTGNEVVHREVPELRDLRGLAFGSTESSFYLTGMGSNWLQVIGRLTAQGDLEVLQRAESAFGELHLSPDGRALAYLEKEFDTDLWLTPIE